MEWIERRAGLIGIGAIVVAAVALGVAIADLGSRSEPRMLRIGPHPFLQPYGAPGIEGGPMLQRFEAGPGGIAPGKKVILHRLGAASGRPIAIPGLAAGGALHGELTMPAPNGKYQTVDVQRGTVTSISSSSLTVKSSDGFTKTYAITKSLASGVSKGDEVQLRATVVNGKATVTGLSALRPPKR